MCSYLLQLDIATMMIKHVANVIARDITSSVGLLNLTACRPFASFRVSAPPFLTEEVKFQKLSKLCSHHIHNEFQIGETNDQDL